MRTAIVYVRGLGTHANSEWCGMRAFLEKLAEFLGADLIGLDYDDSAAIQGLNGRLDGYDMVYGAGHSHGAAALYAWLKTTDRKLGVAAFLDLCPQWQPLAWMGTPWDAPENCDKVVVFYQRNDTPLAGVRLTGKSVEEFDITAWGLHHSTLCADERVHDRIALAILWQHAAAFNGNTKNAVVGA